MSKNKATPVTQSSQIARRSLPFVVLPKREVRRIGDEATGILEIEVYGGLTNSEAVELQRLVRDKKFNELKEKYTDKSVEDIEKMAAEEIAMMELTGFILDYSSDLCTLCLRSRVDKEWTREDTGDLPTALVNGIAALMQEEITAAGRDRTTGEEAEEGDIPNES